MVLCIIHRAYKYCLLNNKIVILWAHLAVFFEVTDSKFSLFGPYQIMFEMLQLNYLEKTVIPTYIPTNVHKICHFWNFVGFSRNGALCFSEELQLLGLGKDEPKEWCKPNGVAP